MPLHFQPSWDKGQAISGAYSSSWVPKPGQSFPTYQYYSHQDKGNATGLSSSLAKSFQLQQHPCLECCRRKDTRIIYLNWLKRLSRATASCNEILFSSREPTAAFLSWGYQPVWPHNLQFKLSSRLSPRMDDLLSIDSPIKNTPLATILQTQRRRKRRCRSSVVEQKLWNRDRNWKSSDNDVNFSNFEPCQNNDIVASRRFAFFFFSNARQMPRVHFWLGNLSKQTHPWEST